MKNSQPKSHVCICRKRDCESLKVLAISQREIKMTVINKVPAKPTTEAVLRLATSEVIYKAFQQTLLESRDLSSCTRLQKGHCLQMP